MNYLARAFTSEQLKELLNAWIDCYMALATGQAKYYRIGTREFQAFDLDEVLKQIRDIQDALDEKNGTSRPRVKRVKFRDL